MGSDDLAVKKVTIRCIKDFTFIEMLQQPI